MRPPVVTIKRRSLMDAQPVYKPLMSDQPITVSDLIERVVRVRDMAHQVERGSRDPEKVASDKNELVRAIGRLEADIRRKGVR